MITQNQLDTALFEYFIVCDKRVAHRGPELVTGNKFPEAIARLELRILVVSLDHFLPLDVETGIQGDIRGEERPLILAVQLFIRLLLWFI